MTEEPFDEAKRQMMTVGSPSDGPNLDGMSIDFDAYLFMAELFEHVAVHQTGDLDCMLIASCTVDHGKTPTVVGEALVDIWQDKLRYHHRAAHRLRQDDFEVYLDVATLTHDGGIFVTGLIKATWNRQP
ncbi:hypothetical protein ACFQZ4_37305 [Catellatospora coxensis]|uniref:Uncharacterized protein n=1 Tax=Catellatospora coxensis TaxID=310354 RepID=A0A8J3KZ36_9ACTN|nr:hypothetical protein [Catellatospora coxensis]GIG03750.1 hypothetical protein Cco03nite_04500 [Catellatospora coxensis]